MADFNILPITFFYRFIPFLYSKIENISIKLVLVARFSGFCQILCIVTIFISIFF